MKFIGYCFKKNSKKLIQYDLNDVDKLTNILQAEGIIIPQNGQLDRGVACEILDDGVRVSTVLLPMDHNFFVRLNQEDTRPLVFETMIFGGEHDQYQQRYTTYDEALEHHEKIVEAIKNEKPLPEFIKNPKWLQEYINMFE